MSEPTRFARARTEQQREERRESILDTAATLLQDSRIAELTLNELARRVGLAKSNVLRYFESREAVLLELMAREYDAWLDVLDRELDSTATADVDRVAEAVARTASERPLLCELLSNASIVLEHNVSADVAAAYKRGALAGAIRLGSLLTGAPADERSALLAGAVNLAVGGVWGMCRPSRGMLAAYEVHPELAAYRLDLRTTLQELVATLLTGAASRRSR
ncbi:TetR family transcriptional regulator [Microbacterium sp. NPDC057944]|uniref:TetR/AcrR family transcriptional regulator n=1 Tax=Microbacterium sp. NPDC057944 TaxID=3346286 RepID=UPI0036D91847